MYRSFIWRTFAAIFRPYMGDGIVLADPSALDQARSRVRELLDARSGLQDALDATIAAPTAENRALTEDETTAFGEARDALTAHDAQLDQARAQEADLASIEARRVAAAEARRAIGDPDTGPDVRVGQEELQYREGGEHSFFSDAYRSQRGDNRASDRLRRHGEQVELEARSGNTETRAVGTSAFGGLVVPQYLVDDFADMLRNGRAFANAVRHEPLPAEGMVLKIPRAQSGSSTASQAAQGDDASETDVDFDDDLDVNVRTISGQQKVSRQALERGTPGIDRLVYGDLVGDYAETLDFQILAADGSAGTHEGVLEMEGENAVTYTDASPTIPEVWPKIANAIQAVGGNRKLPGNLIVMHTRRWGWFIAALDSQNRPLVVADPSAAVNAMGKQTAEKFGEGQLVGTLQGLPVLVDGNIPVTLGAGTEDAIIVLRKEDPILWEEGSGMPRELRFEEVVGSKLQVQLVVYGYSAFTSERRPTAVSIITGTGLIAPTF